MAVASSGANVQALSRSLDKVFDEAQLTGVLSLNGRNLKDFPNVASRYDLTDTVEVDLSKNRFTEFPVQISEFVSLETLHLYHNCIRSIPIVVRFLESLTHLDLSRNQLQCIPGVLCTLPLEVLLLGNNRLSSLPKEIRQLSDTLTELDVSCNRLEELPAEIGDLKKLRVLNVRENLLSELPYALCKLRLQICDVSSNRIGHLNVDLRHMTSLVQFDLNHNPLVFPPAKLCNSGRVHVFKSLEVAFVKQAKRHIAASNEQDYQRRCTTLKPNQIRLIPTDPDDIKFLLTKPERRKNRHHTVAADSGYSTLTDETSKSMRDITDIHLQKRSPPVGEEAPSSTSSLRRHYETDLRVNSNLMSYSMYSSSVSTNGTSLGKSYGGVSSLNGGSDCKPGSFVEEVMSACMERIGQSSSLLSSTPTATSYYHQNNTATTNKDDEVTRELWRQREEYLLKKKRAGLLRMEVLQDAGESMLSPSLTNSVDLNCNNCNGDYRFETNTVLQHKVGRQSPWVANDKRSMVVNGGASSVITEESSSLSSFNASSELTPSPCDHQPSINNVQSLISPTNDSTSICSSSYNNAAPSSSVRTPMVSFASSLSNEKAFSPPRSVKSEVIQSIYNGTAGSPSRYASTNLVTVVSCESRTLSEQPLSVCPSGNSLEHDQCHVQTSTSTVHSVKPSDEQRRISKEESGDSLVSCLSTGGEPDGVKIKKRVNVVDAAQKKPHKETSTTNGRASLSSSQSSVSSSSSASRTKSAGNSSKIGAGANGGCVSNARKLSSSSGSTNAPPPLVKQLPPPTHARSAATTVSNAASVASSSSSSSNRPIMVFHRGCESLQNGASHNVVNNSNVVKKSTDSVERQQQIVDEMRKTLEEKLNIVLPSDFVELAEVLSDGVHLCNYLNFLRPKTVRSVHMPGEAVPKLTLAKRNVENFLTGCRRLAIPENALFAIGDVVDKKSVVNVGRTVNFVTKHLINHSKPKSPTNSSPPEQQQRILTKQR